MKRGSFVGHRGVFLELLKRMKSDRFIYLLLVLAMLFFAGAFYAGKVGIALISPAALTFWRFIIAMLVLLPFALKQPRERFIPRVQDIPLFITIGFVGIFLYHYLVFLALKDTSSVNASVLGAFTPLLTSALAVLWLKEKLSVGRLASLCFAFFGVLLALTGGNWRVLFEMRFNRGDLIMLFAVFFLAIYNVLSKKALVRYTPLSVLFWAMVVSNVLAFPIFLWERPWETFPWHSLPVWASVFYMGVFPSACGYLFLQMGIRAIGVTRCVPFLNLVSIFAMLLSLLFYGQQSLSSAQVISSFVIIIAVYLNSRLA